MEITSILGYIGALLIGLVLGLTGGGGSILTVPILVYLLSLNPLTATAYSLFIVGVSSLVGAINNIHKKLIDVKIALTFASPALIAVYITRKYIVTAIPDVLFSVKNFVVTKDFGIMVFFSLIMLLAAISMIANKKKESNKKTSSKYKHYLIILEGIIVGVITGIVGAGGGFLIIPALVLLTKLPMKKAVATSLLIVAIKSLIGFIGDIENLDIDWNFLLGFTTVSVVGIFIGGRLTNFIDGKKLKKGFGWFVLVMGVYIIIKEFTK